MLDTLAKIYDDGGTLIGVTYASFDRDPRFITAIGLRFESLSAVFRAEPDLDTLAASLGPLTPGPDEVLVEVGGREPWLACIGFGVVWAWRLTNQQGYTDGVRLEFGAPGEASRAVVELIVAASAIELFSGLPCAAA